MREALLIKSVLQSTVSQDRLTSLPLLRVAYAKEDQFCQSQGQLFRRSSKTETIMLSLFMSITNLTLRTSFLLNYINATKNY